MDLLILILILAGISILVLGFYRGWFTANKDKLKEDAKHVIDKL